MNVGQNLGDPSRLGLRRPRTKIGQAVDVYNAANGKHDLRPLKDMLKKVYGDDETIKSLSEDELIELGGNLRHGVPIATPVFDGAKEKDIEKMLDLAGLDRSGQSSVYDGRTGEKFDRQVTVGYIYMLKLHHWWTTRSTPARSARTRWSPSSRSAARRSSAGQRFGEMEVWALEALLARPTRCRKC